MKFNPKALPITSKALFTIIGGAVLINPAFAQEQASELDEVVVTGIRGSLQKSMDIKRNATGVVDAISAEDIGKFPDTNLAESLQRITGVSIDRVNGEGSSVTVRGFGPNFNLVTLNGRQLPAATVGTITGNPTSAGAQGTSRSFDFATLASEGVSGLEVYKTGNAAVPSGGIGATINIKTIKPLESGNKASVGVKAVYDTGSADDDVTPEVSGLVSWANDSQTFGVSAFASYQERKSSVRGISVEQYAFFDYSPDLSFLSAADVANAPADGALMALPSNIGISDAQIDRKRINGMVTFQWAPSENTTITADAMYTSNKLAQDSLVPGMWFSRQFSYIEFNGSDIVATPTRVIEPVALPGNRGKDLFFANYDDNTKDESHTIGLNLEHKFTDAWSVGFDAATSSSESGGDGPNGYNSVRMNVAAAGAGWQGAYWGSGVPTATIGVLDNVANAHGNGNGVLDAPDISTQTFRTIDSTQKTDTDQFGLSAAWDEEDGISVKFGVGAMSTEMHATSRQTEDFLGGWGVGQNPAGQSDIPDPSLLTQVNTLGSFNDLNFVGYPDTAQIPTSGYYFTTLGREAFRVDPWSFAHAMEGNPLYPTWDADNLTQNSFANNTINEDIYSAYGQAKFDGEIAGHEIQTVVGLRYEQTKVKANALQNVASQIVWLSDNDFRGIFGTDLTALRDSADYHNWLPNIDFSLALNDTMKIRASVSQTIARPQYNNMFMTTNVGGPSTPTALGGIPRASKGNASLEPLESTNLDLSFEWYYGEGSYASVGFFKKAVNNFVGTGVTTTPLFDLQDPTSGAPGTLTGDARAALIAGGFQVNEQNLFTMSAVLNNPTDFPNGSADYIDPTNTAEDGAQFALDIIAAYDIPPGANDPLFQFSLSQPVNNQTANIDGEELAWQHFFGDSGFGFQVNATIVNGDVAYNLRARPEIQQFALEGLSDSANAVLIYEKYGLSARVAYNWRDAFLTSTVWQGQQGLPAFVDEYKQIDLNITYNINDRIAVGLDGINITGEGQMIYSRTKDMQWWNGEGDPRWTLTARYNFQ
ncbi:MAG TPA: TonB-dependent receptor [Steroidobacteraceae bacterium]|nr:TonB-dependent receptor [Steroidobacteraceae bacterium]